MLQQKFATEKWLNYTAVWSSPVKQDSVYGSWQIEEPH